VKVYDIVVRNDLTGEIVTVAMSGSVPAEAQTHALIQLFHTHGWRKASALPPEVVSFSVIAEAAEEPA
jgi:transposase InsO family protein